MICWKLILKYSFIQVTFSVEPSSSFNLGSRTNFSTGVVNFLISHHITWKLKLIRKGTHEYSTSHFSYFACFWKISLNKNMPLINHEWIYVFDKSKVTFECVLTVPSVLAVKNSDNVLLWIHIVLYTGSMWDTDRLISPSEINMLWPCI